jgi:hypothetical protein
MSILYFYKFRYEIQEQNEIHEQKEVPVRYAGTYRPISSTVLIHNMWGIYWRAKRLLASGKVWSIHCVT